MLTLQDHPSITQLYAAFVVSERTQIGNRQIGLQLACNGECLRSLAKCLLQPRLWQQFLEVHVNRALILSFALHLQEQGMFATGLNARFTHLSLVLEDAPGGNLAQYLKQR
jgi:hypothetical protein